MLVVGIKYKGKGKVYYFDPMGEEFETGDGAIVETPRGVEYADVAMGNSIVSEREIVGTLKPVIRKATAEDKEQLKKNEADKEEVLKKAGEKVRERGVAMKLIDAEYTFDRAKLIISFTASQRVDFRDLVRDLAAIFRTRIELRQVYERDETKICGALAPCGRICCCANHLGDYQKVSIKMAKMQGLSLNPAKISGICGRLMCCLGYENEYYKKMFSEMPKVNSTAVTPDGEGIVEANDILRLKCKIKLKRGEGFDIRSYDLKDIRSKDRQSEPDDKE
jgi:cell fate regulator YaaT (PSP1 superfamily)